MGILPQEEIKNRLETYYKNVCGEKETDEWLEPQAVNVIRFVRDQKTVFLRCHITNGIVTEKLGTND